MNSVFDDRIFKIRHELECRATRKKQIQKTIKENKKNIKLTEKEITYRKDGVVVIEYLIGKKYDNVLHMFEQTITKALQMLWDDSYEFKLDIGRRGDNASVEFQLLTGEYDVPKLIQMTQGASIKQIVGAIIRIVLVKLDKHLPSFVILDEPCGGLSNSMNSKAGKFFKQLAEDFELQLIFITQSPEFAYKGDEIIDVTEK